MHCLHAVTNIFPESAALDITRCDNTNSSCCEILLMVNAGSTPQALLFNLGEKRNAGHLTKFPGKNRQGPIKQLCVDPQILLFHVPFFCIFFFNCLLSSLPFAIFFSWLAITPATS